MKVRMPAPEGVLTNPATPATILFSLLAGLSLNLVPWPGVASLARPDFLLVLTIYWCIAEPRRVGATAAFAAGLMMDVAEAWLLGQNAMIYSFSAYLAVVLRGRILNFGRIAQALHVLVILLLGQGLFIVQQLVLSAPLPGPWFLLESLLGMAFWPVAAAALELPRRRPLKDEAA